ILAGQLSAVHDVSDGGVAVAIAEMALAGNIGAMIDRKQPHDCARSFFAEDQGVYIVTCDDHAMLDFLAAAHAARVEVEPLGRTGGRRLIFERPDRDDVVALDTLREAHEGFFPKLMGEDAALA
uniref:AIR synthase-related protein n=1 Tax=Sphingomonas sp. TaxID=28214 RepID=UPI0035BC9749